MNKSGRFFVAVLGGFNVMFELFSPIAISLLLLKVYSFSGFNSYAILTVGLLASLFKAIKFWLK